jgi:hypothetical protein
MIDSIDKLYRYDNYEIYKMPTGNEIPETHVQSFFFFIVFPDLRRSTPENFSSTAQDAIIYY